MKIVSKKYGYQGYMSINNVIIQHFIDNSDILALVSEERELQYIDNNLLDDENNIIETLSKDFIDDITPEEISLGTQAIEKYCRDNNLLDILTNYKKVCLNISEDIQEALSSAKSIKIREINLKYDSEIEKAIGDDVPSSEIITWKQQEIESRAYLASEPRDDSLCPTMKAIAEARGSDSLEELCSKCIEKSEKYNKKQNYLIGYRQSLVERIESAEDVNSVNAISWNPKIPE